MNQSVSPQPIRLRLSPSVKADLSIACIHGRVIDCKKVPVLILALSPVSMEITTNLLLPVFGHYVLSFEFQIERVWLKQYGQVALRKKEDNLYRYDISFVPNESNRRMLTGLLNEYIRRTRPKHVEIHQLYSKLSRYDSIG